MRESVQGRTVEFNDTDTAAVYSVEDAEEMLRELAGDAVSAGRRQPLGNHAMV